MGNVAYLVRAVFWFRSFHFEEPAFTLRALHHCSIVVVATANSLSSPIVVSLAHRCAVNSATSTIPGAGRKRSAHQCGPRKRGVKGPGTAHVVPVLVRVLARTTTATLLFCSILPVAHHKAPALSRCSNISMLLVVVVVVVVAMLLVVVVVVVVAMLEGRHRRCRHPSVVLWLVFMMP